MNPHHRSRIAVLIALAFLSGCCALAYEVLYMRALTTLLGDMLHVHAALLSAFLVGIGLGAKLAHRWLRWLWAFEVVTGLYALGVPAAAKWFSGQSMMVAVTGSHALTIVTTAGFLLVPSVLIGFSIPLFSAYIKSEAKDHLAFQGVYAAYNLGAFLSILAVELFLVRQLGVRLSLALVGGVNLMNGAVLLLMKAAPEHAPDVPQRTFEPRVVFALALASVVSAVFQLFFLKLTYLVFAPHRENFAIGLSVTLLGIFLGARLAARVRIRFETCLVLVPVLIGAVYAGWVPLVYLHQATAPLVRGSELLILAHKFAFGCVFALGPMILFGAMLPALMRSEQEVAGESGHLLFVSSLANAAGYLIYVLLGHPLLPTHALLVLLAGATLLASLLGCGFRWTRMHWGVAAVGVGLVALLAGQWQDRNFYLAQWISILRPNQEVMTFKSGSESATLLHEPQRELISYNGHSSISVRKGPFITLEEVISGVIPALSAPRLDRALVLGCGTGITAGTVSRIFRHTDVVEINAAFYEMMPYLSYANLDLETNPNATLHLADGRSFLIGKDDTYDAIVNAIPAPTYYSASKIYTIEFYERVKNALVSDGIFTTWLAVPNMSEEGLLAILSALHKTFRYCDLRLMSPAYYTATCADQPIRERRFSDLRTSGSPRTSSSTSRRSCRTRTPTITRCSSSWWCETSSARRWAGSSFSSSRRCSTSIRSGATNRRTTAGSLAGPPSSPISIRSTSSGTSCR
jgi:predicted membrane-bound spermidine synthase